MSQEKLAFLRTILKPLGLSNDAIDRTIEFISDLLFEKDETSLSKIEYPYHLSEEFITPAELNFFFNLKSIIEESAQIFSKVRCFLNKGRFLESKEPAAIEQNMHTSSGIHSSSPTKSFLFYLYICSS